MARDHNPPASIGTALGLVGIGGFVATILWAVSVGALLDLLGRTGLDLVDQFRVAFGVGLTVQVAAMVQVVRWWRRARAASLDAQARGEPIPVPVVRRRWDLGRRSGHSA